MTPVSLKIPAFEDYAHFYEKRFLDEVIYWADDEHHKLSLNDYAYGRLCAQEEGEILERIIVVNGEPVGTITARDYIKRTCQCTLGIVEPSRRVQAGADHKSRMISRDRSVLQAVDNDQTP